MLVNIMYYIKCRSVCILQVHHYSVYDRNLKREQHAYSTNITYMYVW